VLAADDATIDLQGWVTLDNQSGATYENAQLQLMAGEVRRVQNQRPQPMYDMMVEEVQMARAAAAPPEQESFFEYHLYTFDRPTTIRNREQKQLTLLQADGVGVQRRLILDASGQYFPYRQRRPGAGGSTYDLSAAVVVELTNAEANNMGMPLPKGTVRLYQADRRGNLQFLGEDRIEHTARDEEVRLYVGDAFDVVGTRRQVAQRNLGERLREISWEVEVRNRKEVAAEVFVVERLWGDWTVTEKSADYTKLDATTIEFPVRLDAGETETVRYTVRYQY
jgi:hypothetical protein